MFITYYPAKHDTYTVRSLSTRARGVLGAGVALTRGGWTGRSAPARRALGAEGAAAIAQVKASPPSWPPAPAETRLPAQRAGGGVLACGCAACAWWARGARAGGVGEAGGTRRVPDDDADTRPREAQLRPPSDRRVRLSLHLTRLPLDRHGSFGELEGGAGESARPETAWRWSEVARVTRGWADARAGWRGRCAQTRRGRGALLQLLPCARRVPRRMHAREGAVHLAGVEHAGAGAVRVCRCVPGARARASCPSPLAGEQRPGCTGRRAVVREASRSSRVEGSVAAPRRAAAPRPRAAQRRARAASVSTQPDTTLLAARRRLEDVVGRRHLDRAREIGWVSILRAHPASAKSRGAAGGAESTSARGGCS